MAQLYIRRTVINLVGLLALSIVISLFIFKVHAQTATTPLDLTISPPVVDLSADPGDTIKQKFRIRNNSATPISLTLTPKKLTSNENGEPIPAEPTDQDTYISWMKIDPPTLTAPAKEWSDIDYTIAIPKDAAFGYYYVIQITPKDNQQINENGAKVTGQVLVIVLLNVKKEGAKVTAKLVDFKPSQMVNEYLPVSFTATVTNTGNVHVKPHGNVFIRSGNQKDLAQLDINQTFGTILPNGTRSFVTEWTDGFLVKEPVVEDGKIKTNSKGEPITHLKANWDKLTKIRIGRYTANLLMVYDNGVRDEIIEGTTSFWVIPYKLICGLVVILLVILILFQMTIKAYIRRELNRQRK